MKEIFFFTEMGYYRPPNRRVYPESAIQESPDGDDLLTFPNKWFDPEISHELYHTYFEEQVYASEIGFDGVMINEHHNNPMTMDMSINIIGAVLAGKLKKGRIMMLGNVLPIRDDVVRLAEEIAELDVITGGRLISGIVRGTGMESLAQNANTAYNRERFNEAHDLLIKTWTTHEPFRWEGKHYHYRVVSPFVRPMQQPHPEIALAGGVSPETVEFAAVHGYDYITLAVTFEAAQLIRGQYDACRAAAGLEPIRGKVGNLLQLSVQDTYEKAFEVAEQMMQARGITFDIPKPHWAAPPGYLSPAAKERVLQMASSLGSRFGLDPTKTIREQLEDRIADGRFIVGTPDQVIEKIKSHIDALDPDKLVLMCREGPMSHEDAMRCLELLGTKVIPAVKEHQSAVAASASA